MRIAVLYAAPLTNYSWKTVGQGRCPFNVWLRQTGSAAGEKTLMGCIFMDEIWRAVDSHGLLDETEARLSKGVHFIHSENRVYFAVLQRMLRPISFVV